MKGHVILKIVTILISGECSFICPSVPNGTCFDHNGTCFYRQCGTFNWYEARASCKKVNMHLAVSFIKLDKDLESWLDAQSCDKVWLGYSKEDWYYTPPNAGKRFM